MAPAPIDIVAFVPACLLGMASPKAVLEPKVAVAVTLIRLTGGGHLSIPHEGSRIMKEWHFPCTNSDACPRGSLAQFRGAAVDASAWEYGPT